MPAPRRTAAPPTRRRQPTQERAQRTIEAIFEATAQIVEADGDAALTTNKVAQRAGFSIGTLYQYFPSKEAILLAMIQRERRRVMDRLQAMMQASVAQRRPVQEVLAELVHLLVESFGSGPRSRRAMIRLAWRLDHHDDITQALREASERNTLALIALQDPSLRAPDPALMFVATRAVMGVIRSASLEDSPLLGTPAFEAELVRMVWGLLRLDPAPAPGRAAG
ncbi:TetR/AcrR family transcriptional regulator [Curvibacter sp. RS43]|uniref:TetR/AcrR family transcriptional regulator n=1 Tax=Curvibacter microcysteis TaxID=3026419 RepID=UPI00235E1ADE|nr:TetR/AcrR family transcriptional regulator [Curvibacter sp. RS43]MDD0810183.1 TetR/AcrR family transcriptional regulator [Curvibacter sp. RS43]